MSPPRKDESLQLHIPKKLEGIRDPYRYKALWGGRGGAKSHTFAELLVEKHIKDGSKRSVCVREVQKSIKDSVHQLILDKITNWQANYLFEEKNGEIHRRPETLQDPSQQAGLIIFRGLQHYNVDSIKSLEGYSTAWVEEASAVSTRSWTMLRPTIRLPGSEIWCSWNPRYPSDPVDNFFRSQTPPPNSFIRNINYGDNPWLPKVLIEEMLHDRATMADGGAHVWDGAYEAITVGAYYATQILKMEQAGRIMDLPVDVTIPVHTSWDLGVGDMTSIWFFQVIGAEIRIVDYYENSGMAIGHYVDVIDEKREAGGWLAGTDLVPHDARQRVWTDTDPATGIARQRLEVMKAKGMNPVVVPMHRIADGISAVRETLNLSWFDRDRTGAGLDRLRRYRSEWDEDKQTLKATPHKDYTSHAADAFRYLAMGWKYVTNETPKPPPRGVDAITLDELWELQARMEHNEL